MIQLWKCRSMVAELQLSFTEPLAFIAPPLVDGGKYPILPSLSPRLSHLSPCPSLPIASALATDKGSGDSSSSPAGPNTFWCICHLYIYVFAFWCMFQIIALKLQSLIIPVVFLMTDVHKQRVILYVWLYLPDGRRACS